MNIHIEIVTALYVDPSDHHRIPDNLFDGRLSPSPNFHNAIFTYETDIYFLNGTTLEWTIWRNRLTHSHKNHVSIRVPTELMVHC